MLRSCFEFASIVNQNTFPKFYRTVTTLSPSKITSLLRRNEINLARDVLPKCIKSIESNQLESNNPNEDRLRVSTLRLPGSSEPTLILGVFDGHGKGTTVDVISRRLFNYIALSIHPEPGRLKISDLIDLRSLLVDLQYSPLPRELPHLQDAELKALTNYRDELINSTDISANIKASFKRCDDDLSQEIQDNLINSRAKHQSILHYYLSAAVSGCCALVMVIHDGIGYVASSGDCRAVLGVHEKVVADHQGTNGESTGAKSFYHKINAIELNDEHNCDNINETRRLARSHPSSELNTMIRNNRLLGQLMPFRAFGDFNYKWSSDLIKSCGLTRAYGPGVIPSNYNSPPYLTAEPDVKIIMLDKRPEAGSEDEQEIVGEREKYLVIASDGLWELFEGSRDVVETIVDHSINASQQADDYDENRATHILRSALRSGSQQDIGMDSEELKKLYHIRLESTLTLPQAVVRNFRDDISILVLKL